MKKIRCALETGDYVYVTPANTKICVNLIGFTDVGLHTEDTEEVVMLTKKNVRKLIKQLKKAIK